MSIWRTRRSSHFRLMISFRLLLCSFVSSVWHVGVSFAYSYLDAYATILFLSAALFIIFRDFLTTLVFGRSLRALKVFSWRRSGRPSSS